MERCSKLNRKHHKATVLMCGVPPFGSLDPVPVIPRKIRWSL